MKLEEIAKLAGVSRTTASYVINGKAKQYRVSDKTVEKVMAIVRAHNFQPNVVAAGLRAGKTRSIGIIIPDLENSSYTRIANHFEKLAREQGYQILIACSDDNPEIEKTCILHLQQRRVDAIIISSSFVTDYAFYDQWDNQRLPVFALDRPLDESNFVSVIGADKEDAKVLAFAFNQFLSPTDNIIYLGALPELSVSQRRLEGFRQGIHINDENVTYLWADNYSRVDSDKTITEWLKQHNTLPNGLFATSFSLLQGAIDALLQQFGSLPSTFSIATFGDNELLDFLPCNVISLAQHHQKIAETTLDLLLKSIDNRSYYKPGITRIHRKLAYRGKLARMDL